MFDFLSEPVTISGLSIGFVLVFAFRWRANDKARALIAERLDDLEDRIQKLEK